MTVSFFTKYGKTWIFTGVEVVAFSKKAQHLIRGAQGSTLEIDGDVEDFSGRVFLCYDREVLLYKQA